nr:isochorismate synthase [Echinimonas agarilytica]
MPWLNEQVEFPKLYWQSRDHQTEAAISGSVDTWWLDQACANKATWRRHQTHSEQLDWRYYGGHGFTLGDPRVTEMGGNRLYLPKHEFRRQGDQHWLLFYVAIEPSQWRAQIRKAQAELNNLKAPAPLRAPTLSVSQQEHQPDYSGWEQLVENLTQAQQQLEIPKVVLCRETKLTTEHSPNCWQLLQTWQRQQPHCYHFGIQTNEHSSFFGCSPERLFHRQQQHLQTEALAGTCSRHQDAAQTARMADQLMQDQKNILENRLVADDIQQQLTPLTEHLSIESPAHLVELTQVSHLCRDIHAQLKANVSDQDLLQALHPTAAVGGLPRQSAQQYLIKHEPVKRGWYAGVFGMVGDESSEYCVTIRSIQQHNRELSLYTGAGIVEGSEPCSEWHELNSKLASAMAVVQPAYHE